MLQKSEPRRVRSWMSSDSCMTVTVSMSAIWIKLLTVFCLSCTAQIDPALSDTGNSGVLWKDVGGQFTIQCRCPQSDQDSLTLQKGLHKEFEVLYKVRDSEKNTINAQFSSRLQLNGAMPNVDILITNLTSDDTGPYWCVYKRFDPKSTKTQTTDAGSVLLVVTDRTTQQCDVPNKSLVLGSVVISTAVLLGIILAFFVWFITKNKTYNTSKKPRRVATNDVYEDMRGTLRREARAAVQH